MKNRISKLLAIGLSLAMALSLTACGDSNASGGSANAPKPSAAAPSATPSEAPSEDPQEEARDWSSFHEWAEEDWDAKTIVYQFTGNWDMGDPEYGKAYTFLMNLYEDGSLQTVQYQAGKTDFRYYGSWDVIEDPDGDEVNINMAEMDANLGEGMVAHRYGYTVYARADGTITFDYDFCMAPGQYFRVTALTGSKEVQFDTIAEFQEAAGGSNAPAEGGEAADNGSEGGEAAAADVLFSWECDQGSMDFHPDGTYTFNCGDVSGETGTWKWESWKMHVTNANGVEMNGARDEADNTLHLEYTSSTNDQLTVNMKVASSVWARSLGTTGSYEPAS